MRPKVIVFAKAPRLAQVKTRLAADIGTIQALNFYRRTLTQTLRKLADKRFDLIVAITPDGARLPQPVAHRGQGPGDLGARMARVLAWPGPTAIVGSDIPGLSRHHVAQAFRALRGAHVVLGPSGDGGYWLIATRGSARLNFGNVRWSSEHALADTMAALGRRHVALIDRMDDVDDATSWRRLRRRGDVPRTGA